MKKPYSPPLDADWSRWTAATVAAVPTASWRTVLRSYVKWLEVTCQLAPSTIYTSTSVVAKRLLPACLGSETACVRGIRGLSPADVHDFLAQSRYSKSQSDYVARFLKYCLAQRWLSAEFLHRIPGLSVHFTWSPETLRRRLARVVSSAPTPSAKRVLRSYSIWLEEVRELAVSTALIRTETAKTLLQRWLVEETACVRRLRCLTVDDVEETFFRYHQEDHGPAAQRTLQAGLRSFLRFCVDQGWSARELPAAVPGIRTYRRSRLPRAVAEADVSKLLNAARNPRDRAIFLLVATYGPRRAQVADLRLSDLDWRQRRITFRAHKGGRKVRHDLTPSAGEALANYLATRAECEAQHVFLRLRPPFVPLGPSVVTGIVRELFKRAGVISRPAGPHALRHAFAKRSLATGSSLKTIADLLGHHSLESTAIYAKLDVQRLREAPLDWPEVLR